RMSAKTGRTYSLWPRPLSGFVVPIVRLSGMRLLRSERGAVALVMGLGATVIVAFVGIGIDVIVWYRTERAMQNAADAASIAAARNGTALYDSEAKAVAAEYGFVDGTGRITVTAQNNQTCPNGQTDCYLVTVATSAAPQFFSQVVGLPPPRLSSAAMAGGG